MKHFGLQAADILLPQGGFEAWSVVACDQYTSEPEYWDAVEKAVGDAPSALRVTLPEIYLNDDPNARIAAINRTMAQYLAEGVLKEHPDSMVYIERETSAGVRRGLLGVIDLEEYDYRAGSKTLIRATEQTVVERIPPRVAIRRDAPLELPHVLLLMDDAQHTVFGAAGTEGDVVYDFDLMQGGGHIRGTRLPKAAQERVTAALSALLDGQEDPLLFAVGDGNHSLATAKECYAQDPNPKNRYALVEVVNIHDDSIQFEPIYRVLFHADIAEVTAELAALCGEGEDTQAITCVTAAGETVLNLAPTSKLPVGTLQAFLDAYLKEHPAVTIDYIHGEDTVRRLCAAEGVLGFLFDGMGKDELFPAIRQDGSLPRKTFSMGHAEDKRYYLEARVIR
ncbi:MAG: DUF1015 domain-containing protein [Ruminococcaceae bacterium]|nr:DUF1015 domain-containing protein [Oscillospiraceae bacterium]